MRTSTFPSIMAAMSCCLLCFDYFRAYQSTYLVEHASRFIISCPRFFFRNSALAEPAATPASRIPADYMARVREIHERGGYGSIGYGYDWQVAEAEKNLLRTHTTAVSSRMLYRLAQEGFRAAKYFSIDRVFRNEAIDRTHLAEFHQVEGTRIIIIFFFFFNIPPT
jgi:phenylalanyl-tRNA synthetase alpha subunit